ncbi:hypothetical protein ACHAWF_011974 [Thalassiosira exigua]
MIDSAAAFPQLQETIMNYGGGGGGGGDGASAAGWENILLTSYFGAGGDGGSAPGNGANGGGGDDGGGGGLLGGVGGSGTPTPAPLNPYDGYAAYVQQAAAGGLPAGGGGSGDQAANPYSHPYAPPPPAAAAPPGGGLGYSAAQGYALTMPSAHASPYCEPAAGPGYDPGEGYGHPYDCGAGGNPYGNGTNHLPPPPPQQQQQQQQPFGMLDAAVGGGGGSASRSRSDESGNSGGAAAAGGGGDYSGGYYAPPPPAEAPLNPYDPASLPAAPPPPPPRGGPSPSDLDYCDAILNNLADPMGWLTGAAAVLGGGRGASNGALNPYGGSYGPPPTPRRSHPHRHPTAAQAQAQAGGFSLGAGGEHLLLPGRRAGGTDDDDGPGSPDEAQRRRPGAGGARRAGGEKKPPARSSARSSARAGGGGSRSRRARTSSSSAAAAAGVAVMTAAAAATTASSARLSPSGRDHSSVPSAQIDPLLETVSLDVTSVSLTPLSGNEVVRHVRTKTDDVITRFLPCVDFLVNCQQELRQGLQLASRPRPRGGRNARGGGAGAGGMTPRQFHAAYVAPLPRRFERRNESIMERGHLRDARRKLDDLVRDALGAAPQGCDHVKNAFLGGMRENESWGLRKWLSKHGGAGAICNDLEEVMRHVKALERTSESTRRLAAMLRPIARQAHDRLKKDVPAAYQERSTAHPYLPFFHRLEACLKQMATYDPEEDDVICLDDSSDEDEDVKVVVGRVKSSSAHVGSSPAVKKRGGAASPTKPEKRKSDDDGEEVASKWARDCVGNEAKRSRADVDDGDFAKGFFGGGDGDDGGGDKKPVAKKGEAEVICLDSSSEGEEEEKADDNDDENIDDDDAEAQAGAEPEADGEEYAELRKTASDGGYASGYASPALEYASPTPPDPPGVAAAAIGEGKGEEEDGALSSALVAAAAQLAQATATATMTGETSTATPTHAGAHEQWRCAQCTFLNEAFASKCVMCDDDEESAAEEGGGRMEGEGSTGTDELAAFLGGSGFLDGNHSFSAPGSLHAGTSEGGGDASGSADASDPPSRGALQGADARELASLAEHVAAGGSLPRQAHYDADPFWSRTDVFPRVLELFRTVLQDPASRRWLEPPDEGRPYATGTPRYDSVVRHPLCFHAIVGALSRSEDAVTMPHLTMRLSNGRLPNAVGELSRWNMWDGKRLIEAIDLVLLNSLAYDRAGGREEARSSDEARSLRTALWNGVDDVLRERLRPDERVQQLPRKRSARGSFVSLLAGEHGEGR